MLLKSNVMESARCEISGCFSDDSPNAGNCNSGEKTDQISPQT
jgi:hypothetical protein